MSSLRTTDFATAQPLVVDIGSGVVKAGFSGDDAPRCCFQNVVGEPKHPRLMRGGELQGQSRLFGNQAIKNRGLLRLHRPMDHGLVQDWDTMEGVWRTVYDESNLGVVPTEHPVLVPERPFVSSSQRHQLMETVFEKLRVPAVCMMSSSVLTLYGTGRTDGIVVDCGDGVCSTVPVCDGFGIEHGALRMNLGGRDVTRQLQLLLRKDGYLMDSSADFDVLREAQENMCYVSSDPAAEEASVASRKSLEQNYTLPDGSRINLGPSTFRAPEILFNPSLVGKETPGVAEMVVESVNAADLDIRPRLLREIVLVGGATMYPGFGNRLLKDIKSKTPHGSKIRISASEQRRNLAWIGGSVFAAMGGSRELWVSKADYDEGAW